MHLMFQLPLMELNTLRMRTKCDVETVPFLCEFCDKAMEEEDHDFCDICDECRDEHLT